MTKEERLLKKIFGKHKEEDDRPRTIIDLVGFSELLVTKSLENISRSIVRLSRLHRLLTITQKDGQDKLPDIITNNEARMALEALVPAKNEINDAVAYLLAVYRATKQPEAETEPDKAKKGEKGGQE